MAVAGMAVAVLIRIIQLMTIAVAAAVPGMFIRVHLHGRIRLDVCSTAVSI